MTDERASLFPDAERLTKIASEAMHALAKYLQTHDEMYLMDAYRLLRDEVGGESRFGEPS